MYKQTPNLVIENARFHYRDFSGEKNLNNKRSFGIRIEDSEQAASLLADGWNVKLASQRDPDDPPLYYLPVEVRYDKRPPEIYVIASRRKTEITEEEIHRLDEVWFEKVDLTINPSYWEVNGKTGIKAYLMELYGFVREGELSQKYAEYDFEG